MPDLTEAELEEAGVPLTCGCGSELNHYATKTEVHVECTNCGFEDVFVAADGLY